MALATRILENRICATMVFPVPADRAADAAATAGDQGDPDVLMIEMSAQTSRSSGRNRVDARKSLRNPEGLGFIVVFLDHKPPRTSIHDLAVLRVSTLTLMPTP
jgi:hypothetical protein